MSKLSFLLVFFLGFVAYSGMNLVFKETNTLEFCTSCHTMQQNFVEYKESQHYKNHAGVRAICSDCHVPKSPMAKIVAKIYAGKDLYHEIMGTIDTPEKFEKHRFEMATRVWDKMKQTDSRECRSCHSWDAMMFDVQDKSASKKHQRAKSAGKTCIDCHKGIVHEIPDEPINKTSQTAVMAADVQAEKKSDKPIAKEVDKKENNTELKQAEISKAPVTAVAENTDSDDAGEITDLVNACNKCHGKNGNSQDLDAPNIANASAIYLFDSLVAFKNGTRKGNEYKKPDGEVTDMNKITADLNEEQFNALAQYYSSKELIHRPQTANKEMAEVGAKIFDKNCEKCHADGGTDPDDDAGLIAGQPKNYLLKQFANFSEGRRKIPRKMAKKFKKLNDEQKLQIIEFLIRHTIHD